MTLCQKCILGLYPDNLLKGSRNSGGGAVVLGCIQALLVILRNAKKEAGGLNLRTEASVSYSLTVPCLNIHIEPEGSLAEGTWITVILMVGFGLAKCKFLIY